LAPTTDRIATTKLAPEENRGITLTRKKFDLVTDEITGKNNRF
jgi:hypothetical protein